MIDKYTCEILDFHYFPPIRYYIFLSPEQYISATTLFSTQSKNFWQKILPTLGDAKICIKFLPLSETLLCIFIHKSQQIWPNINNGNMPLQGIIYAQFLCMRNGTRSPILARVWWGFTLLRGTGKDIADYSFRT